LLPLFLGLRAACRVWRDYRQREADPEEEREPVTRQDSGIWQVAAVTFANGGDNR
jgi:cadmium resistance protein CadD (predicted permease)